MIKKLPDDHRRGAFFDKKFLGTKKRVKKYKKVFRREILETIDKNIFF